MNPKTTRIIYWIATGLFALLVLPGIFFLNSKMAIEGTSHLGIPHWFHMELGIGKFIGALLLILPYVPKRLREWTYVAFGIDTISATIGLIAIDGWHPASFAPLLSFAILLVSYIFYHKSYDKA